MQTIPVNTEIRQENIEPGPKGLYSPRSNIGWEEYTNDRLDSELHRCASTEKDLTLIIMEFVDVMSDDMFMQAAEEAVAFFSSRDLLFEHGTQGILAILPGIELNAGLSKSEKFYQRKMEKFPNSYKSSSSFCIGLSSRSGRLLNAERLMLETEEALHKAKRDRKSSIIAFKSDPEKYRAFIASQN
jgi:GGDEF domain-containing protein